MYGYTRAAKKTRSNHHATTIPAASFLPGRKFFAPKCKDGCIAAAVAVDQYQQSSSPLFLPILHVTVSSLLISIYTTIIIIDKMSVLAMIWHLRMFNIFGGI